MTPRILWPVIASNSPQSNVRLPANIPPELLQAWQAAQTDQERARVLMKMGYFMEGQSKWQATELHKQACAHALRSDDPVLGIQTLLSLAFAQANATRYTEAYQSVGQAIRIAQSAEKPEFVLDALNVRGFIRMSVGDERGARQDFRQILEATASTGHSELRMLARGNLSTLANESGQPEAALHHLNLLRELLEEIRAKAESQGKVYSGYDHYNLVTTGNEAQAYATKAELLHKKGRTLAMQEAIQKSWERIHACHALLEKQHENPKARMYLGIWSAKVARLSGDLPASREYIEQALKIAKETGQNTHFEVYAGLGQYFVASLNWPEALGAYRQALGAARNIGGPRAIQELLGEIAQIYEHMYDLPNALSTLKEALAAAQQTIRGIDELYALADQDDENFDLSAAHQSDLTWHERLQMAEQQAQQDPLTLLLNRRGLEAKLPHIKEETTRNQELLLVAVMDLDHFKRVNDQFSHAVGDIVLRTTAHLLSDILPSDSLLARYGGEEFVAIMQIKDRASACELLEGCRLAICEHDWSDLLHGSTQSISIGYALGAAEDDHQLLGEADEALYKAKQLGRNRVAHKDHEL